MNKFEHNKKTLVIFDPYYPFLVRHLRDDGFNLIAVFSEEREAEGLYYYDPNEFSGIYIADQDYCKLLSKLQSHHIDGVVMGSDMESEGLGLALQLTHDLKIKDSNPLSLKGSLGNKFKTAALLRKKKVPLAEQILVHSDTVEEGIELASKKIGYPLIIKPTESSASFGFYICHSAETLKQNIHALLGVTDVFLNVIDEVVIEEYLQGTEYAISTVTQAGEHAIPVICRYEQSIVEGSNLIRSISVVEPNEEGIDALQQYALQVLDALEYRQGQSVIEVMLTEKGPRLIEFNPRVAGLRGRFDIFVNACTGMSPTALASLSYRDFKAFQGYVGKPYVCKKHGKIIILKNYKDGFVQTLEHVDKFRQLSSFQDMNILLNVNEKFKRTIEFGTTPGYVLLAHEDIVQLQQDIEVIEAAEKKGLFYYH